MRLRKGSAEEIHPGIFRLRLPLPGGKPDHINAYVFTGSHPLLFDTGMHQSAVHLENALAGLGLSFSDLECVILSHRHFDHYGAAADILKRSGKSIPMIAHPSEAPYMAAQNGLGLSIADLWQWLTVSGVPFRYKATVTLVALLFKTFARKIQVNHFSSEDESILAGDYQARIIEAPGHSEGVLCLYLPGENLLFSSDHILPYLPHSDPFLFHLKGGIERFNQEEYFKSLKSMADLGPSKVFPGHGDPICDMEAVLAGYHKEYLKKDRRILAFIQSEPATAYEIACGLFPRVFKRLNGFAVYIAVSEVYTHLQVLVRDGKVVTKLQNGVIRFLIHPGS